MIELPLAIFKAIATQLNKTGVSWAYTGGSILRFLLDQPSLTTTRATDDVDVIIELLANKDYTTLESTLRSLGFVNDDTQGAPICRWLFQDRVTVDIMPTQGELFGLKTSLFSEALETANVHLVDSVECKVVSPAGFLATKYAAFKDRGARDYFSSHDLEDIITVIDGRANIVSEIQESHPRIGSYLRSAFRELLASANFQEALPGHLPPDKPSQSRIPLILSRIRQITDMDIQKD